MNTFVNVKNLILKYQGLIENSKYYFPSVTSLTLSGGHSDTLLTTERIQYLKMMTNLSKLKHLGILGNTNIDAYLLLEIFEQAPQLSSMSLTPDLSSKDIKQSRYIRIFNQND